MHCERCNAVFDWGGGEALCPECQEDEFNGIDDSWDETDVRDDPYDDGRGGRTDDDQ